ncbi:MAG: FAD-dependent oxidoreductase [Dehalococcoidia bacterium]
MYDLIIIGAGPAGMTAAVYAARKKMNALLLSKDHGGQLLWTSGIENYMGFQFIEGFELMQKFEEQVKQFPLEQRIGQGAVSLAQVDGGFEIGTDASESYQAKAVIIATGKRPRQLGVPGEEELKGRGVTYCATCDGPLFAGEKVAVIGGGNSALEAADDMIKIAEHVHLISLTALDGDQIIIDRVKNATNVSILVEHTVTEIHGSGRVEGVTIKDLRTGDQSKLDVGAVFIEIGLIPNSEFAKGISRRNEVDEIEVDQGCEMGVPGLFAAGDVTNVPEKQIVVAAGEGAKAALRAQRYLQRL